MQRKEHWRQDTPRQQQVALLQCILGHIRNCEEGRITPEQLLERLTSNPVTGNLAEEVMELTRFIPDTDWELHR